MIFNFLIAIKSVFFLLIEINFTFSICNKILTNYVYSHCILIGIV